MASAPSPSPSGLVLYGSETGNAQDAAVQVHDTLRRLRFRSRLLELDAISGLGELLQFDFVVFVISTTGQGHLPANSQKFWKAVRRAKLPRNCFQSLKFTSFGLGDRNYPKFNWAHRKLYNRLIQLSANPIFERGEGDEQHHEGINGGFLPWLAGLKQSLLAQFPIPTGIEPIPEGELLPPEWVLRLAPPCDSTDELPPPTPSQTVTDSIGTPVTVRVCQNVRVTPESHWQDVRHIVLQAEGSYPYGPGDVLSIQPRNFSRDVDQFLDLMGLAEHGDSIVHLDAVKESHTEASDLLHPSPPPVVFPSGTTLRDFLTNYLDIMSIPRRSFFSLLHHFSTDADQKERLLEFADPTLIDELFDYTTRPRRSILEILQEFTSVNIPLRWLPTIIPLMKPRQFSLASGGDLKRPSPGLTSFELLVAIVRYRTVIKRIRQGVCTSYLATWTPGEQYQVLLRPGTMSFSPTDLELPTIMVGPGTGVAPMRSLIWEKFSSKDDFASSTLASSSPPAENSEPTDLLFFGCRNRTADYFFSSEWADITARSGGRFQVFPAFSRDQRTKVYVQDLIRRHAPLVYRLLTADKPALVYVCGSSGKMPESVREALIYVFQTGGRDISLTESAVGALTVPSEPLPVSREDAEGKLAELESAGRFREDTW